MCRVSVIVPVYQVEQWLPACLDSLLFQSFRDFEIILVDDGTMDNCNEIMESYRRRDGRIRIIHKENGGLSSARNAGLDVAEGEYIAFLDSDDTAEPDWLLDTVAAADRDHADMVLYNYRKVENGQAGAPFLPIKDETFDFGAYGLQKYFYQYWMPYVHGQEAWSRIYRRNLIEAHGLRFALNKDVFAEDTLFSAMCMMHAERLTALSRSYIQYLQRGDSLMGKPKPYLARRLMELSVRLTDYAEKTGHGKELQQVLPVLCYDKLICKGIRFDPSSADVLSAMEQYRANPTMQMILKRLRSPMPLLSYTFHTGKGFATQVRGRMFAARWLSGDYAGAASLVEGRIGQ
ncbi:MAG: glycosyltransferase family 2 protein [Clostridia bacterium]|nr:glycosyltransferase family 2 protein [Clostridia bacterium]